jgi:hypothetical protein
MSSHRLPTYFISHGGGPWPYMEDLRNKLQVLEKSLAEIPRAIGVVPKAVLVISGHWEEDEFTVMASRHPPMLYDYSGSHFRTSCATAWQQLWGGSKGAEAGKRVGTVSLKAPIQAHESTFRALQLLLGRQETRADQRRERDFRSELCVGDDRRA